MSVMKADDRTGMFKISASGEDYLEAVLVLHRKTGYVRCVDIAEFLGYSKPSISHAVALLETGGYLVRRKDGGLTLTESGSRIAELTYEKHCFFKTQLMNAGVDREVADREACRMEHAISEDSFLKMKLNMDRKGVL